MVDDAKAVLPAEVRYKAPRVVYSKAESTLALEDSVDLLDEAHDIAVERSTIYQQKATPQILCQRRHGPVTEAARAP